MNLGGLISCIFIFGFGSMMGRLLGLWIASALSIISLSIQIGSHTTAALYVGRLLLGMSNGFFSTYSGTYMGEISPAYLRGSIVGMVIFQASWGSLMGILVGNYTQTDLTRLSYQLPLAIMYVVPVVLGIGLIFLPDTPRYYVSRGQNDKAANAIRQLRGIGDEDHIHNLVATMEAAWLAETRMGEGARLKDLFLGTDLRRTIISASCGIAQTATGLVFLGAFAVYFYIQAQIGSPFVWVMVAISIGLMANLAAFPAARYLDRRLLLITCSVINAALMLAIGTVYTVFHVGSPSAGKILVGLSITVTWVRGIGQSPVLWAVEAEVPSKRLRSRTVGLAQALDFVFAWLCSYCTPYFTNPESLNWDPKYCYIWAGRNFILAVWVFLVFPETRGRSLEQLDELFENKVPTWKFAKYVTNFKPDATELSIGLGAGKGTTVEIMDVERK
jgi:SP family sugar:H+ symporter-like MFS transporter